MTSTQIDDVRRRIERAHELLGHNGHNVGRARELLADVGRDLFEYFRDAQSKEIRETA